MKELVFMLEEPSAKAMLEGLLPRLLSANYRFRCIVFEGKQDLEKSLVRRMQSYLKPNAFFIVLRDQDFGNCKLIKQNLVNLSSRANQPNSLIRIACRELESWYLADLAAVEKGLEFPGLSQHQNKRKFRNPDPLGSPSKVLEQLTKGTYQKISGSRLIGPFLDLNNSRSRSFYEFIKGIRRIINLK